MGLDMYLHREYYVQNWEHTPKEHRHNITILEGNKPSRIPVDKITCVITSEVYWREANAIHKWFVDTVQDGKDDCGDYYVDTEQLKELLSLVTQVLEDHTKASELLPTGIGFFFGSTEYDKYYFEDLKFTKKELTRVLAIDDSGEFKYYSSW